MFLFVYLQLLVLWALFEVDAFTYVSEGSSDFIKVYVTMIIGAFLLQYVCDRILNKITKCMVKEFKTSAIKLYDNLDWQSKHKNTTTLFKIYVDTSSSAIHTIISWGFQCIINVITDTMACIWVFYKKNFISQFCIIVFIYYLFYIVIIKKRYTALKTVRTENMKKTTCMDDTVIWLLFRLQHNECDAKSIYDIICNIEDDYYVISILFVNIMWLISVPQYIAYFALMIFNPSSTTFIVMCYVIKQFNSSVGRIISFQNQYHKIATDYGLFYDFWKDLKVAPPPDPWSLPEIWTIKIGTVISDGFILRIDTSLIYKHNTKVLITGPSGGGKSTFLNAVLGYIPGLELEFGNPLNFTHCISYCCQSLKERVPTTNTTLQQLFSECSREQMNTYLEACCLNKTNHDGKLLSFVDKFDGIDKPINDKLSGGEKQRLAIAICLHNVRNRQILILDEPEQGLDAATTVQMIVNIIELLKNKIVFIVSHKPDNLSHIHFDTYLSVIDGVISQQIPVKTVTKF